jgi:hypothetical protein
VCTLTCFPNGERVEMGVRSAPSNGPVGRLKGSRGAINRTISVVDQIHLDRSLGQVDNTSITKKRCGFDSVSLQRQTVQGRITLTL